MAEKKDQAKEVESAVEEDDNPEVEDENDKKGKRRRMK